VATHLTRKELKQDNIALKVEETFGFLGAHRRQTVRIVIATLVLVLIVAAIIFYRNSQREVRQQMLGEAIAAQNAPVGSAAPNGALSFPTEQAKRDAVRKAYERLLSEHSGSAEGYIAEYSLAGMDVESGKNDEARRRYQDVIDHANSSYASLAKLSMAQIDFATNRSAEAQALLRDLMDHPTDLVSKAQATIAYAKAIAPTRTDEARKLLSQVASQPGDTSSIAMTAINELPQK